VGENHDFVHTLLHSTHPFGATFGILSLRLVWKNYPVVNRFDDMFSRFDRMPARDGQMDRRLATA